MKKIIFIYIALSIVVKFSSASVFVVSNFTDNASGNAPVNTLRWAIEQANAQVGLDQISFQTSSLQTIDLQQNLPIITDPVEISGPQGNITGANWNNLLVTIEGLDAGTLSVGVEYCFKVQSQNCKIEHLRFTKSKFQVWMSGTNNRIVSCNFISGYRGFVLDDAKSCKVYGCLFGSSSLTTMSSSEAMAEPNTDVCFFYSTTPVNSNQQNQIGGLVTNEFNVFMNYTGAAYYSQGSTSPLGLVSAIELIKNGASPQILGNRFVASQSLITNPEISNAAITCAMNNNVSQCNYNALPNGSFYVNTCADPNLFKLAVCPQNNYIEFIQLNSNPDIVHTYVYLPTTNSSFSNDFTFYDRIAMTSFCNVVILPNLNPPFKMLYYQSLSNLNYTKAKVEDFTSPLINESICACPSIVVTTNPSNPHEGETIFNSGDSIYVSYNGTMHPSGVSVIDGSTGAVVYNGGNTGFVLSTGDHDLVFVSGTIPIGTYPVEIVPPLSPEEQECENCIPSFSPTKNKAYLLSVWVKEVNNPPVNTGYLGPKIKIMSNNGTVTTILTQTNKRIKVVDDWQLNELEFTIPANSVSISIKFECQAQNNADCLFDDLRVIPLEAGAKSYVYDPITKKVRAELDQQHFSTLYEYDGEGNLTRIKKETERGIMTIKESSRSLRKK